MSQAKLYTEIILAILTTVFLGLYWDLEFSKVTLSYFKHTTSI